MENHVNHVNENVSVPKWKFRENMHKRKVQSIWYSNKFFRKNEYYSYLKIRPNTESSILFGDQLFERTNSSNYSLELCTGGLSQLPVVEMSWEKNSKKKPSVHNIFCFLVNFIRHTGPTVTMGHQAAPLFSPWNTDRRPSISSISWQRCIPPAWKFWTLVKANRSPYISLEAVTVPYISFGHKITDISWQYYLLSD